MMTADLAIKMGITFLIVSIAMLGIGMAFDEDNPERWGKICLTFAVAGLGFAIAGMWMAS